MAQKQNDKLNNAQQGRIALRQQYPALGEDIHAWWYGLFDSQQPFFDLAGKPTTRGLCNETNSQCPAKCSRTKQYQ